MRAQRTKSNTKKSGKMANKRYHRSHLCERSIVRRMSNQTTYVDIIRHRICLESRIIRDIFICFCLLIGEWPHSGWFAGPQANISPLKQWQVSKHLSQHANCHMLTDDGFPKRWSNASQFSSPTWRFPKMLITPTTVGFNWFQLASILKCSDLDDLVPVSPLPAPQAFGSPSTRVPRTIHG